MLPPRHKLHRPADFRATIRGGRRAGRRTLVLHLRRVRATDVDADAGPARWGGPRVGLVVSKKVGDAVTRHAVSRRLRHVMLGLAGEIGDDADIVIRALPAAAHASSAELEGDIRSALAKLA